MCLYYGYIIPRVYYTCYKIVPAGAVVLSNTCYRHALIRYLNCADPLTSLAVVQINVT